MHDSLLLNGLFFHDGFAVRAENGLAFVVLFLDRDFVRLDELGFRVRLEILNHPLRHEKHREDQADGQQQVVSHAHQIHPKIAKRSGRMPGDTAHQRSSERDADGGGGKVVNRQCDHLREVGHRGFADVALPVGVGRETDGGIKCEVGTQRAEALRIERQQVLQAQNCVGKNATDQTEKQHGERVLFPIVLLVGAHSHQAIREPLQRTEHRVEPGFAVRIEHAQEIKPHWFRNHHKCDNVERELKPSIGVHSHSSKFLRANHRHEQVDEQKQSNDSCDEVFHNAFLEFFTETDVKAAHDKKCHHNAHENQVTHKTSPATELTTRVRSYRYDDSVADERIIKISAFRVKISLRELWSLNSLPRPH